MELNCFLIIMCLVGLMKNEIVNCHEQGDIDTLVMSIMKEQGLEKCTERLDVMEIALRDQGAKISQLELALQIQKEENSLISKANKLLKSRILDLDKRLTPLNKDVEDEDFKQDRETDNGEWKNDETDSSEVFAEKSDQKQHPVNTVPRIRRATGHVAFTAYLDHTVDHIGVGQTIKFNQVLINDGNGYNKFTGVFIAPVSGTYFFTFAITIYDRQINVKLVKDGQNIVGSVAHANTNMMSHNSHQVQSGNSAVTNLTEGQSVWVEELYDKDVTIYSLPGYRYISFTGFLLY